MIDINAGRGWGKRTPFWWTICIFAAVAFGIICLPIGIGIDCLGWEEIGERIALGGGMVFCAGGHGALLSMVVHDKEGPIVGYVRGVDLSNAPVKYWLYVAFFLMLTVASLAFAPAILLGLVEFGPVR